ncbi:unnamed protein product [Orchesella dallaii]|uniref:AMP deaminase n=1 Tax=Orchesella dallaii TaxID=48710 RepID=A0ABP1RY13_9HEXA
MSSGDGSNDKPPVLPKDVAVQVVEALEMRQNFLQLSHQKVNTTTESFLKRARDTDGPSGSKRGKLDTVGPETMIYQHHKNGVAVFSGGNNGRVSPYDAVTIPGLMMAFMTILNLIKIVSFNIYAAFQFGCLNTCYESFEAAEDVNKNISPFDYRTVRKVDNHNHDAGCGIAEILLELIKIALGRPDIVYIGRDGVRMNLADMLRSLGLTTKQLTTKEMKCKADKTIFRNFLNFRSKFTIFGHSCLRKLFLKSDNVNEGALFAEYINNVTRQIMLTGSQAVEICITVHGTHMEEWQEIANWFVRKIVDRPTCVTWLVQVPRTFHEHMKAEKGPKNTIDCFATFLANIFSPIFINSMSNNHKSEEDKNLAKFLCRVVAFDCVDYEDFDDMRQDINIQPCDWQEGNPPYFYYTFYLFKNITDINIMRSALGLNTFSYRPHSGETGNYLNLSAAFLCGQSIAHGINLQKYPALKLLYYLAQIEITVAPRSNHFLCELFHDNPLKRFFNEGLLVTLGTDDPLVFHNTINSLLEEYFHAETQFMFTDMELCEMARRSVVMSQFPNQLKSTWICRDGSSYEGETDFVNEPLKTNVSNERLLFRQIHLEKQLKLIFQAAEISLSK